MIIWFLKAIKTLNPIATELFIRGGKLNIYLVFITQSYFVVPKDIRLNSTYYFVMKIQNKLELQQTAFNNSSDIDYNLILLDYDLFLFSDWYYSCIRYSSMFYRESFKENIKINHDNWW